VLKISKQGLHEIMNDILGNKTQKKIILRYPSVRASGAGFPYIYFNKVKICQKMVI